MYAISIMVPSINQNEPCHGKTYFCIEKIKAQISCRVTSVQSLYFLNFKTLNHLQLGLCQTWSLMTGSPMTRPISFIIVAKMA